MIKALAFDVFGTVVDWRSNIIAELEEFGRSHGLPQDWPAFADRWRAGYAPAMDRVRRGDLQAARDAGLKTAYVTRPLEYGPGCLPHAVDEREFDITATDFLGLADRLGA